MPTPIFTPNVKAPPAMTSEAFGFVWTTTPHPQQKDTVNAFLYDNDVLV